MPTVLIIAASPVDQDRLRLGAEEKEIRQALRRSSNRENWKVESNLAATVDDLRRAILDFEPTILHFAGHGGPDGLCFETNDGESHIPTAESVAKLLHIFRQTLKCVVLNACYSKSQAELIREQIDYVVGMSKGIFDDPARRFAVAFYDAIFAGTDYRVAFELGCTTLDLNALPDGEVPIFLTTKAKERTTLAYATHVPEVERVLHDYLNSPFVDRACFTTSGAALIPTLQRHYGERIHVEIDRVRVAGMYQLSEEHWRVLAEVFRDGQCKVEKFYVRIWNRSVLVEWEASVGHWSIPVKTYRALGHDGEVVARVKAELGTEYYGCFDSQEHAWQSVNLCAQDFTRLHGYVKRHSPVGIELTEILSDGQEHNLTLGLRVAAVDPEYSIISSLLSKTWLYHPPPKD